MLQRPPSLNTTSLGRPGVRRALQLGFGSVLLCLIGITGVAQWALDSSSTRIQAVADQQIQTADLTRNMSDTIGQAYQALLSSVLLENPEDLAFQKKRLIDALQRYGKTESALSVALTSGHPGLLELRQTLTQRAEEVQRSLEPMQDRLGDPNERELMAGFVANTMQPNFETWLQALQQLDQARKQAADEEASQVQKQVRTARISLLIFAAMALAFGAVATVLISRSILNPLRRAVALSQAVAQGDLTATIEQETAGEVGALTHALRQMQESLRELVSQVQHSSEGVTNASREIALGHQDLSNRTEDTATNLQRAACAVTELGENTRTTAKATQRARTLSEASEAAARHGNGVATEVAESMNSIHATGKQMTEIVEVIEGIAFQTNILALNASVEAARAGDHGRSFAVVAEEVRTLAQRCAKASQDIRALINLNVDTVETGRDRVYRIVTAMNEIAMSVQQVGGLITDISNSTERQDQDTQSLNAAVEALETMTQKNAALVEETTAATLRLRDEMTDLSRLVHRFRVKST